LDVLDVVHEPEDQIPAFPLIEIGNRGFLVGFEKRGTEILDDPLAEKSGQIVESITEDGSGRDENEHHAHVRREKRLVDAARGELVNEFACQERDEELAPGRKEGEEKREDDDPLRSLEIRPKPLELFHA
jgi:hypothetical protein